MQAQEDLATHTADLSANQLWTRPMEVNAVGFHLRHIAGSVRRLTAYLEERALTDVELQQLAQEKQPGASRAELLGLVAETCRHFEQVARSLPPERWPEPRYVGRQRLATTVAGLLVHIAEHTQRHVGQAITTAQWVRRAGGGCDTD